MCPMCEKRAQLLLQQQQQHQQQVLAAAAAGESYPGTPRASLKPPGIPSSQTNKSSSLFRNPFKSCKNLSHQCCSPVCESHRTSIYSVRRSSVRPSTTPDHSGEILSHQDDYRVLESSFNHDQSHKENQQPVVKAVGASLNPNPNPAQAGQFVEQKRKPRGLLTRLKLLTQGATSSQPPEAGKRWQGEISSPDSSFTVMAVADNPEQVREYTGMIISRSPQLISLLAAETSLDTISEASSNVTATNVSESTTISMRNLNGSSSSPLQMSFRGSTLKSSTYDDDASTFAIIPRTSMNSQDWTSDASGLSDRFGELDIGYLSLEESGEGPDIDDTVSISSSQCEDVDLQRHDMVSESDLDQDYSIGTDSQEWCTVPEDTASVLQWSRGHISKNHLHLHLPDLETTPPHELTDSPHRLASLPRHNSLSEKHRQEPDADDDDDDEEEEPTKAEETAPDMEVMQPEVTKGPISPPRSKCTEYLCSRCGRKEQKLVHPEGQSEKKMTRKPNPMAAYFSTVMDGEDQAVMAAKVVVLLGKYGNRRGLRVAGLAAGGSMTRDSSPNEVHLSAKELDRLRSMMCPSNDAVSAFQNEVARMMLEGVDVPGLNMDVEQFIAGYMKLNSPFYIDLVEDFFKSVCIDCFGHMEVQGDGSGSQRPAYTVLKSRRRGSKHAVKGLAGKR